MICPRCDNQGTVLKATIKEKNFVIYICDECEAIWLQKDLISIQHFEDFGEFMSNLGLKGLWSELTDIEDC